MILESRKWRLIVPGLALLITTALILGFAGPASYALQDDTPRLIYGPAQLSEHKLDGRFAVLRAQAALDRAVALHREGHTSYWVPVSGYNDARGASLLFVLTDDIYGAPTPEQDLPAGGDGPAFVGRLVRFADAPHADDAEKVLAEAEGAPVVPKDAYVLIEGEAPKTYRPMVPLVGGLGLVWFLALVSFTRAWRRTPRRVR
jgi:hypothetical protein